MKIDYFVNNPAHANRELSRPWIYGIRHIKTAFLSAEALKSKSKTEKVGLEKIILIQESNDKPGKISCMERVGHLCLGLMELALPILNYFIAYFDVKGHENKGIINEGKPLEELRSDRDVIESINQQNIDDIYDIFEILHDILSSPEHKVKYCLTCGSQLGASRHKGLIRWDDDGDVIVHENDKNAVFALQQEFEKRGCGFSYDSNWGVINVYLKKRPNKYPAVDIFFFKPIDGVLKYSGIISRLKWKKEYLTFEEWKNVTTTRFGHLDLIGLSENDATNYLKRTYGEGCLLTGVKTHSHVDPLVTPKRELVRIDDFSPARHSSKDCEYNKGK